jgi:hypothetical protein
MNEQFYKLINNKRLVLLIPGVVIIVAAVVLLLLAILPTPVGKEEAQLTSESHESIMSELVRNQEYLAQLESLVSDNWKLLDQDGSGDSTFLSQYEVLEEKLSELVSELSFFAENTEITDERMKTLLANIISSLTVIRQDVQTSQQDYMAMLESLGGDVQQLGRRMGGDVEQLTSLNNASLKTISEAISEIQVFYSETHEEVKLLYEELQKTSVGHQEELLEALEQMLERLGNDMEALYARFAALESQIEESTAALDSRLDELFTYASSGKEMLASTLTGLGVPTTLDADNGIYASFKEIDDNIRKLASLRLRDLPEAVISYVYHYHKDANEAEPHTESLALNSGYAPGGCYGTLVYHQHVGSENTGCYRYSTHRHSNACPQSTIDNKYCSNNSSHPVVNDPTGVYVNGICTICGPGTIEHGGETTYYCNNLPLNSGSVTVCEKTTSTIEGYRASCKYYDGEMISATVHFNWH